MSKRTNPRDYGHSLAVVAHAGLGGILAASIVFSTVFTYRAMHPFLGGLAWTVSAVLDVVLLAALVAELRGGSMSLHHGRAQAIGYGVMAASGVLVLVEVNRASTWSDPVSYAAPVLMVGAKVLYSTLAPMLTSGVSAEMRQTLKQRRQELIDATADAEARTIEHAEQARTVGRFREHLAGIESDYVEVTAQANETLAEVYEGARENLERERPQIDIPVLGEWLPVSGRTSVASVAKGVAMPALTAASPQGEGHTKATQVNGGYQAQGHTRATPGPHRPVVQDEADTDEADAFDPESLAAAAQVAGVETPEPGEPLDDAQLAVVLRHLRHATNPPRSYRHGYRIYRAAGFTGNEHRIRKAWRELAPDQDEDEDVDA